MEDNKCFALNERGYCRILKVGKCTDPQRCKFFKTWEQIWEEEERLRGRRRRCE